MQSNRNRNLLLGLYGLLTLVSIFLLTRLKFTFDFEQFFPQGDPDWEFFKNYIKSLKMHFGGAQCTVTLFYICAFLKI